MLDDYNKGFKAGMKRSMSIIQRLSLEWRNRMMLTAKIANYINVLSFNLRQEIKKYNG